MTDPVRCNSLKRFSHLGRLMPNSKEASANADFESLAQLDKQIKSFNVGPNPYTWFTMEALADT